MDSVSSLIGLVWWAMARTPKVIFPSWSLAWFKIDDAHEVRSDSQKKDDDQGDHNPRS